jgi:Ca2+-transporting ATPase
MKNGKLWLALAGVLAMQAVVVHWTPAQMLFGTTDLSPADWFKATLVASSVLILDEVRKFGLRLIRTR